MKKPKKRLPTKQRGERPADILFWFRDGTLSSYRARVTANTEVSIGRTDSKRALGFVVTSGKAQVDFVLDRDQVAELAAFLQQCALPRLLKPLGPKRSQMSLAALNSPKRRLHMALEKAATSAHPGWHVVDDNTLEADDGAPQGAKLVAWFKKTHPRDVARIEQALTKKLWEGA
jgi:hypothetical protein